MRDTHLARLDKKNYLKEKYKNNRNKNKNNNKEKKSKIVFELKKSIDLSIEELTILTLQEKIDETSNREKYSIDKKSYLDHMQEHLLKRYALATKEPDETVFDLSHFNEIINPTTPLKEEIKYLRTPAYLLEAEITLDRPYFSKDDEIFYFINNPLKKEHVFKVPMVSPSTWKGNLRWVGMKQITDMVAANSSDYREKIKNMRLQMIRLFGNETKAEQMYLDQFFSKNEIDGLKDDLLKLADKRGDFKGELSFKGELNFYATYFNGLGYEVTHKLKEERIGTNPVTYEVAPAGSQGTFQLLYIPGQTVGLEQMEKDLITIQSWLADLFFVYGFSAKGSHWGIACDPISVNIYCSHECNKNRVPLSKKSDGGESDGNENS